MAIDKISRLPYPLPQFTKCTIHNGEFATHIGYDNSALMFLTSEGPQKRFVYYLCSTCVLEYEKEQLLKLKEGA